MRSFRSCKYFCFCDKTIFSRLVYGVYFNQLSGGLSTKKLFEIVFWLMSNFFLLINLFTSFYFFGWKDEKYVIMLDLWPFICHSLAWYLAEHLNKYLNIYLVRTSPKSWLKYTACEHINSPLQKLSWK